MINLALVQLVKIELPSTGETIRLTDGGAIKWGSEVFMASHATYGALAAAETVEEGIGATIPSAKLVLHVPTSSAAAQLLVPGSQTARIRWWMAEYNIETAQVVGTPDIGFDGFLDQSTLVRDGNGLSLEIEVVSRLERFFEYNIGNSLNPTHHKYVWPNETGEDHATGLSLPDAWGVDGPAGAYAAPGTSGGGTGGGSGSRLANLPATGTPDWR